MEISRICALLLATLSVNVLAADPPDKTPEIPRCSQQLGTIAVDEPRSQWWHAYNLGNPEALIKQMIMKSGCFQLVDRNRGMAMRGAERGLADAGELQRDSSIGKGQVVAADYFVIPDIISQDDNSGGGNIGGVVGGLVGGKVGALLGGVQSKNLEAHTLLTVVNTRTSVQELIAEGTFKKSDISFNLGAALFGSGGGLAGVGGGYEDTEIGRIVTAAYIDAYTNMVSQMGGLAANAKAAAPIPTHVMVESSRMYKQPGGDNAEVVRMLRQGTEVYPTGQKSDIYWEIEDPVGNLGWVSSEFLMQSK